MKKISALFLALIMLFSFTACSYNAQTSSSSENSIWSELIQSGNSSNAAESTISSSTASTSTTQSSTSEATASSTSITSEERIPESVSDNRQDTSTKPNQSTNPSSVISSSSTTGEPQSTASTEQSSVNRPQQSSSESMSSQSTSPEKPNTSSSSSSEPVVSTIPPQPNPEPVGTKILVAYFSATNTTKGVAQTIADCVNGDLYEITPEQPYTSADLDYNSDSSRSTIEMNNPNSRPAILGSVENMEQYDIVFIGYPIWWGEAPRILSTFVESYDFSGKTVVPFCTSGGSGVGSSANNLERQAGSGTWLSGTRLTGSASISTVENWINDLGLNIIVG